MKRWWLIVAIIVGLELMGGAIMYFVHPPTIPASIYEAANFPVLTPRASILRLDSASVVYDANTRVLRYQVRAFNGNLTINQQPAPVSFINNPSQYDDLTHSLNQYQTLETHLGTMYLARPKDLAGRQVAVLNTAGTLIFIYPSFELGTQQWTRLFSGLSLRD
jgi:hypothetical protein